MRFSRPTSDEPAAIGAAIDKALSSEPAAMVLAMPPNGLTVEDAARLRRLSGPLVVIGALPADVQASGSVDVDWAEGAALLAGALPQVAPDARSALLLHDRGVNEASAGRYERFVERLRVRAGLRLLDQREWRAAGPPAADLLSEMLGVFPHAGVIAVIAGEPCEPIARRGEAGKPPAHGRLVLLGAHPRRWKHLRDESVLALVGAIEPRLALDALELSIDLCNGRAAGVRQLIPCELVTRGTLDDFARRYAAAAGVQPAELEAMAESASADAEHAAP